MVDAQRDLSRDVEIHVLHLDFDGLPAGLRGRRHFRRGCGLGFLLGAINRRLNGRARKRQRNGYR
jgi:hypothetical protein